MCNAQGSGKILISSTYFPYILGDFHQIEIEDIARSLQEQGQEGSVAISAPIEAKDELAETGLEALGAQPVIDAPRPALEVAERGVDPGENFMGGPPVADDMGPVAVPRRRAAAGWPRRSRPDRTAGCARGSHGAAKLGGEHPGAAAGFDPEPLRNCRAEMPLQWVAIRWAAQNQIASDSLVRCRRWPRFDDGSRRT